MARSNIIKKPKNYLASLKTLTKLLSTKKRSIEQIEFFISKYDIDNTIMRRILTYLIGTPYIHWYCNKYLNNKFSFNRFDTKDLLLSLIHLIDINRLNDAKQFFYLKSNDMKDDFRQPAKKLLREYFDSIGDIFYNDKELNFIYKLFNLGYITDNDLSEIDILMNNKSTIKINRITLSNDNNEEFDIENTFPDITTNVLQFINTLFEKKNNQCQKCPLFSRPMVVLDTNAKNLQEVDITFIGLNPGKDDVDQNRPFVDDGGKEIRKIIAKLPPGTTWLIMNFILCFTYNKKEIEKLAGNVEVVQDHCGLLTKEIMDTFPSKFYVPIGGDAWKRFNISTDQISVASGKIYNIGEGKFIPIVHPSSVLKARNRYQGIFDKSVNNILSQFSNQNQQTESHATFRTEQKKAQKTDMYKANIDFIPNENIINEINEDLTFFDVKELTNNQLLFIYIDLTGTKKYMIKNYTFDFYIKANDYINSKLIENDINYKVTVPGNRKHYIIKSVREYLNDLKRS